MQHNPANSKTRQVWWHGTSPVRLRSILKHGLVPAGHSRFVKSVFDNDDRNGFRSIRTFGGIYLTPRASKAENYGLGADRKFRGAEKHSALIVAMSLDARTPSVWADEDHIVLALEQATAIRSRNDFHLIPDPGHRLYELREHNSAIHFDLKRLPEVVDILFRTDYTEQIDKFLALLQYGSDERVAKQCAVKWPQVQATCQHLMRAYVLHLLEMACLAAPAQYEYEVWSALHQNKNPERADRLRVESARNLAVLEQRPAALRNTWQQLTQTTDVLCKLLPALSVPVSIYSSVRMQEQIGYAGKNRILLVLEVPSETEGTVKDSNNQTWYKKTVTVHYCADQKTLDDYAQKCQEAQVLPVFVRPRAAMQYAENPVRNRLRYLGRAVRFRGF